MQFLSNGAGQLYEMHEATHICANVAVETLTTAFKEMHQHKAFLGSVPEEQSHGQKQEPPWHLPFLLPRECHTLYISATRIQLPIECVFRSSADLHDSPVIYIFF